MTVIALSFMGKTGECTTLGGVDGSCDLVISSVCVTPSTQNAPRARNTNTFRRLSPVVRQGCWNIDSISEALEKEALYNFSSLKIILRKVEYGMVAIDSICL